MAGAPRASADGAGPDRELDVRGGAGSAAGPFPRGRAAGRSRAGRRRARGPGGCRRLGRAAPSAATRRLVHALANTAAVGMYAASLACRLKGREAAGRTFGFLGLTAVGLGGALGGHMAYRQASGANHAEEVPHVVTRGWHRVGGVDEFPAGRPVRRSVDDVPVLVVREIGGAVHALAERCSHLAGPLSEGTVADGCVQCPWHGSVFRLADGWNVRGPATAPQPAFDTRIVDGHVEIRLRQQDGEADRRAVGTGAGSARGNTG
ncbi:Rieske protein [Streptomyces viridosporus ATCC 14672]|uniref:Rieske protein n=1 Tax=Streptomyces viridosporus (strain ATCC 14672 / DSM 40746 / JCM 4963 / KCTC 9882 / NRRL B-12104 / FH 1290) TaxID=566461 RepID=D6A1I5_STRV1|nr:Rieske protein [Streptomyces viridosporus ATCC 14672]